MRQIALLILCTCSSLLLLGQQGTKITVSFVDIPLDVVFQKVTQESRFFFSYNPDILPKGSRFTMNARNEEMDVFMKKLLLGTGLGFVRLDDQIIVTRNQSPPQTDVQIYYEIAGKVTDLGTSEGIQGVNIFLEGTNLGAVSDLDGNYKISDVPVGSYEIVFSHVSYALLERTAELYADGLLTLNVDMDPKILELDSVEIVAVPFLDGGERNRKLSIFKSEFLGKSVNAMQCQIINPEVLDFTLLEDSSRLEVNADKPLLIQNESLGYKITYYFEYFNYEYNKVSFHGRAKFEDLEPENPRERKRWVKKRRKIYKGSFLHFRRSLVQDRLKKEGFDIRIIEGSDPSLVSYASSKPIDRDQIISEVAPNEYELNFDGFLLVSYKKRPDEAYADEFFEGVTTGIKQRSLITLADGPVSIKQNGRMEFPGVSLFGYWYWERMADLLPENFDPNSGNFDTN